MLSYIVRVSFVVFVILMSGCGSSSSSVDQRPVLNEQNVVASVEEHVILDEEALVDGVVVKDIVIPIAQESKEGEENKTVLEVTLVAGTAFIDSEGNPVQEPPVLQVVQKESHSIEENGNQAEISNVVKGEIRFVDAKGEKIIPTEPVEITMAAPEGSKPGDEVRVEIPDGVDKAVGQEKLTIFIVDENGNIRIVVAPTVFETLDVVVVVIEKIEVVVNDTLTGAEGGN